MDYRSKYNFSQVIEYPRKKKYLLSLNLLLDAQPQTVPQQLLASKLFPAKKLTTSLSLTRVRKIRAQTSVQSRASKQKEQFRATVFTKMKESWQKRLSTAELKGIRKIPRSQSTQLNSSIPLQAYAYSSVKTKTQRQKQQQNNIKYQETTNPRNPQIQRDFLRKGSSINKQIVVNLLKIKLNRQRDQRQAQKDFQNQQILKMIKLYKGGNQITNYEKSQSLKNNILLKAPQSRLNKITGWQNDQVEEYY